MTHTKQAGKQQGVALITGLIFMVILTLLAVAAMRTTTLEEKMAGNARNRDLAFQAAEAGLRSAQQALDSPVDPATGAGYFATPLAAGGTIDYWKTYSGWSTATGSANPGVIYPGVQRVRYVIEKITALAGSSGNDDLGYSAAPGNPRNGIYRITARADAGSGGDTSVILQSVVQIVLE